MASHDQRVNSSPMEKKVIDGELNHDAWVEEWKKFEQRSKATLMFIDSDVIAQ